MQSARPSKPNDRNALLEKRKKQFREGKYKQSHLGLFHIKFGERDSDIEKKLISTGRAIQVKKKKNENTLKTLVFNKHLIERKLRQLGSLGKLKIDFVKAMDELNGAIENMPNCLAKVVLQNIYHDNTSTTANILQELVEYINQRFEYSHIAIENNVKSDIRNLMIAFLTTISLFKQLGKLGFLLSLALMSTIAMPDREYQEEIALNNILAAIDNIYVVADRLQLYKDNKPKLKKALHDIDDKINALIKDIDFANAQLENINARLDILYSENTEEKNISSHQL